MERSEEWLLTIVCDVGEDFPGVFCVSGWEEHEERAFFAGESEAVGC